MSLATPNGGAVTVPPSLGVSTQQLVAAFNATQSDKWYVQFEQWLEQNYYAPGTPPIPLIRYDTQLEEWCQYEDGVFHPIAEEIIDKIIIDWATSINYTTRTNTFTLAKLRLAAMVATNHKKFDATPGVLNIKNGILDLRVSPPVLTPHTPARLFYQQYGVRLLTTDPNLIPPTPYIDRVRTTYFNAFFMIERFCQAVLHADFSNEMMLFISGPTGSGKGTMMQCIKGLFRVCMSTAALATLDGSFGLYPLVRSRVNIDDDAAMGELGQNAISELKKLTGRDYIEDPGALINCKGVKQFQAPLKCFFITATNQFPRIPSGVDRLAWFRRCLIVDFNQIQPTDNDLKDHIIDDIDAWFTELVLMPYTAWTVKGFDKKRHAELAAEKWDYSANPVHRYIEEMFERGTQDTDDFLQDDVCDWIRQRMTADTYTIPSELGLKQWITNEMSRFRIRARTAKYGVKHYFPIKLKGKWVAECVPYKASGEDSDGAVGARVNRGQITGYAAPTNESASIPEFDPGRDGAYN